MEAQQATMTEEELYQLDSHLLEMQNAALNEGDFARVDELLDERTDLQQYAEGRGVML